MIGLRQTFERMVINQGKLTNRDTEHSKHCRLRNDAPIQKQYEVAYCTCPAGGGLWTKDYFQTDDSWEELIKQDGYIRLNERVWAKAWNEAPAGLNPVDSIEILIHCATEAWKIDEEPVRTQVGFFINEAGERELEVIPVHVQE